jgi:hypothetical protein
MRAVRSIAGMCGVELMEVLYVSTGVDSVRARTKVLMVLEWMRQEHPEDLPGVLEATLRYADGDLDGAWEEAFDGVPRKAVIRREPGVREAFVKAAMGDVEKRRAVGA